MKHQRKKYTRKHLLGSLYDDSHTETTPELDKALDMLQNREVLPQQTLEIQIQPNISSTTLKKGTV